MHDLPRQKLSELLAQHGVALCNDARRLEGLLKDLLRNEYRRETIVLISALREGVVHELRGSTSGIPPVTLAAKLAKQLCDNLALDEAAARWSVESWVFALGVEITTPIKPVAPVNTSAANSATVVAVDLAALATQHREKARLQELKSQQDREKAAQAEAHRVQLEQEAKIRQAALEKEAKIRQMAVEKEAKANAAIVQKQAKELAEQSRDFAAAAQMLENIDPQWCDPKLYNSICGYRDQVRTLDVSIQNAVNKGRLRLLRGRVLELLKLQPKRDDMRRLLEVLPDEPELAKEFTNSIGMKFVLIQPGEFMMGSTFAANEMPPHLVEITQPFYFGVYPVTQAEYQAVMGTNPSHFTGDARLPVEQVNWAQSLSFCETLNRLAVESQRKAHYRLPTEAEWEYACRAGSTGKWCFGDDESLLGDYAWFEGNSENRTHPVGEKKPNAWGVYDTSGNVWEWCEDCCDAEAYKGRSSITEDPLVTSGLLRVYRGGSWCDPAWRCRSAYRSGYGPLGRFRILGFRLVLSFPSDPVTTGQETCRAKHEV